MSTIPRERNKDVTWNVGGNDDGRFIAVENDTQALKALLMDVRDELKQMNNRLACLKRSNFLAIAVVLRRISKNTAKPRKKRSA